MPAAPPSVFIPATEGGEPTAPAEVFTPAAGGGVAASASGTITFTGQPSAGQTITIGSRVYEAIASGPPASPSEFIIGATYLDTAQAFLTAINVGYFSTPDPLVTATRADGVVTVEAITAGEDGNAITLTEAASNVTVSGATLSGGTDGIAAPPSIFTPAS